MKAFSLNHTIMKNLIFSCSLLLLTALTACNKPTPSPEPEKPVVTPAPAPKPVNEALCYHWELKKDEEACQLQINGDMVTGYYVWAPAEKDQGWGILLNGIKNGDTITADWKYMIEGSIQTEQVVLKQVGDTLQKMEGELEEKDGKLVIKNLATAKVGSTLKKVDCTQLATYSTGIKAQEASLRDAK